MNWYQNILNQLHERDIKVIKDTHKFLDKNDGKVFISEDHGDYTILKLYCKDGFDKILIHDYITLIDFY